MTRQQIRNRIDVVFGVVLLALIFAMVFYS